MKPKRYEAYMKKQLSFVQRWVEEGKLPDDWIKKFAGVYRKEWEEADLRDALNVLNFIIRKLRGKNNKQLIKLIKKCIGEIEEALELIEEEEKTEKKKADGGE